MGQASTLHNRPLAQQGAAADGLPEGWVTQSPFNMEEGNLDAFNKPRWMALDGGDSPITILGDTMKKRWPAGVFTSTARTLAAIPAAAVIAASPTYFVASAVAGVAAAQFSTDGATYAQTSLVSPASTQVNCLLFTTGASTPRWVFGCSGTTTCCVTTGDNPGSTWTACTGNFTTTLRYGLCHSPSLDLTLLIPDAAGAAVYTMPGTNTTFTSRAVTSATKLGGVWDGYYFVVITSTVGLIQRSATGTSGWADVYSSTLPSNIIGISSDGVGTIVVTSNDTTLGGCVYVSKDSGASWKRIWLPVEINAVLNTSGAAQQNSAQDISFANGKFFIGVTNSTTTEAYNLISITGLFWVVEPIGKRGVAATNVKSIAWKSNVYASVANATATTALSHTEDTTQFRRPSSFRGASTFVSALAYQEYMKVRP